MSKQMYVEFALEYGRFFPEYDTEKVSEPDPAAINPPERCYAFRFWEREEIDKDGETLTGDRRDVGPLYFIGGKVETAEDVARRNDPKEKILLSNMQCNNYDVIHTRCGRALPFEPDKHKVIAEPA